jgi:hypothetical protein
MPRNGTRISWPAEPQTEQGYRLVALLISKGNQARGRVKADAR